MRFVPSCETVIVTCVWPNQGVKWSFCQQGINRDVPRGEKKRLENTRHCVWLFRRLFIIERVLLLTLLSRSFCRLQRPFLPLQCHLGLHKLLSESHYLRVEIQRIQTRLQTSDRQNISVSNQR